MNKKNLIILCIVFAVLISLTFFKKSMKLEVPTTEEVADIIEPSISSDSLTEIKIRIGDGISDDADQPKNVHLAKEGDHWIVKTHYGIYARDQVITTLIKKLDQLKGELRSNKKGILSDYGIDDDQAVHVTLQREGANAIKVLIGTKTAGYQNNFVRLAGSNAVYVVDENLLGDFGVRDKDEGKELNGSKWVDKRIAHFDVNEIVGVSISQMIKEDVKQIVDIVKEDVDGKKQWKSVTPLPFGISATKIKALVQGFNNAYAREVVAPDIEGAFDEHVWTGVFTKENGEKVTIIRGKKDEPGVSYYVKHEGALYYYVVPLATFDNLERRHGSIFANNPLKSDEKSISEIEIKDLVNKKKFHVLKKTPEETEETDEADEESADDQAKEKEDFWETSGGEVVEIAKVREVINKIKEFSLEAVLQPEISVDDTMILRIVREGVLTEYTISGDLKLDSGKECHFLRVGEKLQSYCVSKSAVTALQNVLPEGKKK